MKIGFLTRNIEACTKPKACEVIQKIYGLQLQDHNYYLQPWSLTSSQDSQGGTERPDILRNLPYKGQVRRITPYKGAGLRINQVLTDMARDGGQDPSTKPAFRP